MDIFEKAKEIIGVTGQKTEEVINVQKLRFRAATVSNKISMQYEKLGKLYYDSQKGISVDENSMNEVVLLIDKLSAEHNDLQRQIADLKGSVVCNECGATVSNSYEYCYKCGHKL